MRCFVERDTCFGCFERWKRIFGKIVFLTILSCGIVMSSKDLISFIPTIGTMKIWHDQFVYLFWCLHHIQFFFLIVNGCMVVYYCLHSHSCLIGNPTTSPYFYFNIFLTKYVPAIMTYASRSCHVQIYEHIN